MATVTIFADAADGTVYSFHGNYATAREGANQGTIANEGRVGVFFSDPFEVYETFLSFDTSAIGGTPTAVTLSLDGNADFTTTDVTVEARLYDWSTTLTGADFRAGSALGGLTLLASWSSAGYSAAYNNFTESGSAFTDNLNLGGTTRIVVCSDLHRLGTTPTNDQWVAFKVSEAAGTTEDPKIVVTTATAPTVATPATVGAVTAVAVPTVSTGTKALPATVATVSAVAAPTVSTGQKSTPAAVAATATIPGPATSTGTKALSATVATAVAVAVPTTSTGTRAPPATVATVSAVAAPTVSAGQQASPTTVAALGAVGAPVIAISATAAPDTVAAVVTIGLPVVAPPVPHHHSPIDLAVEPSVTTTAEGGLPDRTVAITEAPRTVSVNDDGLRTLELV